MPGDPHSFGHDSDTQPFRILTIDDFHDDPNAHERKHYLQSIALADPRPSRQ